MDTVKLTPQMPDGNKCPQCGTPLPAGALAGLCPACLLKMGAATDTVTEGKQPPFVPPSVAELTPQFPQLEILELIGKGGMGAVYKARQKQLDRFVALKVLPPGIGDDPAFAERFTREAKALAKLNHPGIVTLYEFGRAELTLGQNQEAERQPRSTAPLYYFLMEFVDGVNLRQLLHAGRVSAREALAIVPQICEALQFAHDQGIVHRDIKPENILLDRRGRVKVADFGLAKIIGEAGRAGGLLSAEASQTIGGAQGTARPTSELTDAGKVMGTPQYMSPEQIHAPGEVDHRADIYALGVVFYQMLTGELPGKSIAPPSTKVQIDVRLDEVVLRALEKKPELRYQQVSEFKTQVETIVTTPPGSRRGDVAQTEESEIQNPKSGIETRLATLAVNGHYGQLALGLFLSGTLGTLLLMTVSYRHELALIFGGVALTLAVVFGVLGWRQRFGKFVVLTLGGVTGILAFISLIVFALYLPERRERLKAEMERAIATETAQLAAAVERANTLKLSFGPVVERLLPMDERGLSEVLDLDSGNILPRPAAWGFGIAAHGGQPAGVSIYSRETQMINGSGSTFIASLARDEWETTAADAVARSLTQRPGGPRASGASARDDELPKTFSFQTKAGNYGLLQVTGFTDNPRAVNIRYKLVQRSPSKTSQPVPTGTAFADMRFTFKDGRIWATNKQGITTFSHFTTDIGNGQWLTLDGTNVVITTNTPLEITSAWRADDPADLRGARAKLAELRVDYSPQHPAVRKSLARIRELERMSKEEPNASAELRDAKAQLMELRVDYAEQHPRVQQALIKVKTLEQK